MREAGVGVKESEYKVFEWYESNSKLPVSRYHSTTNRGITNLSKRLFAGYYTVSINVCFEQDMCLMI